MVVRGASAALLLVLIGGCGALRGAGFEALITEVDVEQSEVVLCGEDGLRRRVALAPHLDSEGWTLQHLSEHAVDRTAVGVWLEGEETVVQLADLDIDPRRFARC